MENLWVTYVDRSYQQIKDRVLTVLQSKVPEMTDHSETNIFVKMLSVWSGIAEMLGYYTDNMAREAYLNTCRLYKSAVKIAEMFDYSVKPSAPSYVDITFTLDTVSTHLTTIPQNTEVKGTDYNFSFFTTEILEIQAGQLEGVVGAVQSELIQNVNIGLSDGSINQKFILPDESTAYNTVSVIIGLDLWENKQTLAYSLETDNHFITSVNENKQPYIKFGDGIKGAIPLNGEGIIIDYRITKGIEGNTAIANTLTTIESVLTLPPDVTEITCNNVNKAAGGTGVETLEELKSRIPKSLRTLNRAVTDLDFKDIAELSVGVLKAAIYFECGHPVNVFVVPIGGGIAPQSLLDEVDTWFLDKKIINIETKAETAGTMLIDITIDVTALATYQNSVVQTSVTDAITNLYSWGSKEIKDTLYLSNIYQTIENTDGVKNSHINNIIIHPFARAIGGSLAELDWDCVITEEAVNQSYIIEFTSATQFGVFRNNAFVGTYTVGNQVILDDVIFTINSNYAAEDKWQFYSYESIVKNGILNMQEFSAPISGNIVVQVTGGV